MQLVKDSECGKTVAFSLVGLETAVYFEGQLCTVRQLLTETDRNVGSIAGHVAVMDGDSGELVGLSKDLAYAGPQYFVPESPVPSPIDIMSVGQFANDLAIGTTIEPVGDDGDRATAQERAVYGSRSKESNLLVLVQRLERDPDSPSEKSVLRPSRPISTLSRSVTFRNKAPMEIGCQYGDRYWTEDERQ